VEYRADVGGGMVEHEVVDIFVAAASRNAVLSPDPVEVMEARWISLTELDREISSRPDAFTPWLRIYLSEYRDMLFSTAEQHPRDVS
jgi:isopentenyl-diphosphate delta-isomerase